MQARPGPATGEKREWSRPGVFSGPDDSFGFDDDESLNPARPDMAKENPEEPVPSVEPRPCSFLFHDCELLVQGVILFNEIKL